MLRGGSAKSRQGRSPSSSSKFQHVSGASRLLVGNRLLHDVLLSNEAGNAHVDEHRPHTGHSCWQSAATTTLSELLIRQEAGETIDVSELARQVEIATAHVIEKQVEAGVDVGNDGEQSRVGFQTYVPRCLCGFGGESRRPPVTGSNRLSKLCPADGTAFSALCAGGERASSAV